MIFILKDKKTSIFLYTILVILVVLLSFSFFRAPTVDETIYIRDTLIIYKSLKACENPFQYNVGLHGVFFKLPVALIYFITGPSIFVATLFSILLGICSLIIFYRLVNKYFFSDLWALIPVIFLAFNYRFLGAGTTFLREMPVLFSFILFLYFVFANKSKLLIGFSLVLILDAKEHVFFTTAIPYLIILVIENWQKKERGITSRISNFILEAIYVYMPAIIYIVLMFTTNLIPVNMFIASILGIVDKNLRFISTQFSIEKSTSNILKSDARKISTFSGNSGFFPRSFLKIINSFILYVGKILYPRTFSFLSVPKLIIIPSIAMSYKKFRESWKSIDLSNYIYLAIFMWFYLIVYILRASHGRYLFPITPIIFIFFVCFLKECSKHEKFSLITVLTAGLFTIGGLLFESTYILIKAIINIVLFIIMLFFILQNNNSMVRKGYLLILMVIVISVTYISAFFLYSLTTGQIHIYKSWGRNFEGAAVFRKIEDSEIIWVNDIGWQQLPVYSRNDLGYISESRYTLKNWIPASYLMKKPKLRTYYFHWDNIEDFESKVKQENISKVVLVRSTLKEEFNMQDVLELLLNASWLELVEVDVSLKNKEVYIFSVS